MHVGRYPRNPRKKDAIIFGLGNYAKTAILPNIKAKFNISEVHEIDPYQLDFLRNANQMMTSDTSPLPRGNALFDAWFISGYHHTHVDLAISALSTGATAVIEKPLLRLFS